MYKIVKYILYKNIMRTKIFIFSGESINEGKCKTKITIEEKISNKIKIYDISYDHTLVYKDKEIPIRCTKDIIKPCPFALSRFNYKDYYDGVIVVKNDMTEQMVRFLMMDDEEL